MFDYICPLICLDFPEYIWLNIMQCEDLRGKKKESVHISASIQTIGKQETEKINRSVENWTLMLK